MNVPTLRHFLHLYMHQDYDLDYGDHVGAMDAYLAEGPPGCDRQVAGEIDALLAECADEADVTRAVRDLGASIDASHMPGGNTTFLAELSRRAHQHAEGA